jgi:hypothetical protein
VPPAATATAQARAAARALLETLEPASDEQEAVVEQLELVAGGQHSDYEAFLEPLLAETPAAGDRP